MINFCCCCNAFAPCLGLIVSGFLGAIFFFHTYSSQIILLCHTQYLLKEEMVLDPPVRLLLYLVLHHCKCFLPEDIKHYVTSDRDNSF